MYATYDKDFPHAFVAGEKELRKLGMLLEEFIGDLSEVTADCNDDVTRTFGTIEQLLGYENAKGKQIERIKLSAHSSDLINRASIALSNTEWKGISVRIEAPDPVVMRLREAVLDIINGMVPWYSWLRRIDAVLVLGGLFFTMWVLVIVSVAFGIITLPESRETDPATRALYQFLMFLIMIGAFVWTYRIRDRVFPRGIFLVGQGKTRFNFLEKIQWGVIIGFFVSLVAGFVPLLVSR